MIKNIICTIFYSPNSNFLAFGTDIFTEIITANMPAVSLPIITGNIKVGWKLAVNAR